ncbi:MAG: enoyl-CoA hydratase/isomerase family protein [Chloroflexi bacterium]|nr:enoyl-CoA hydratase/isomerase family protein [Chloroflexota bacterium]
MEFKEIIYKKDGHIAYLTFNRPEALNAITPTMVDEWVAALTDAKRDTDVRVLVVTGAGRAFCAGADVKGLAKRDSRDLSVEEERPLAEKLNIGRQGIQKIPRSLEDLDKPIIASVNGPAVGGGMDIASMCDIRIASEKARFGMSHLRISRFSMDGGYWFLQRVIGKAKTLELVLTCRIIDASEASQMGYVSKVVPHEQLEAATKELATQISKNPPIAVQLAKRLIYHAEGSTLDELLEEVELSHVLIEGTEDYKEGPRAFVEKREPQYKGR